MTDANYRDDDPNTDTPSSFNDRFGTGNMTAPDTPQTDRSIQPKPGSTPALVNPPPATKPPPTYQPPPNQPNRVGPDQSPIGGGLGPGGPASGQTPGIPPFGPFGLPPFRAAPRQPYIPAMANRPPHEWGTDRRFPMMPHMWEVPGMYRGLGRKLAQWGPGFVAPFAAMMGQHSGAWMRGYMQGQEQLARLQHQRMSMAAEETERRMSTMMREYQQIHAIYGDDPKNAHKLDQALRNAANKYQDQQMLNAFDTIGHEGAMGLLKWYDAQHSDLKAANKTRKHHDDVEEAEAPYKTGGTQTGSSGVPAETPATPAATAEEPQPLTVAPEGEGAMPPGETAPAASDAVTGTPPQTPTPPQTTPPDATGAQTQAEGDQDLAPVGASPLGAEQQPEQPEEGQPSEGEMGVAESKLAAGLRARGGVQAAPAAARPRPLSSPSLDAAAAAGFNPHDIDDVAQKMLLGQFKQTEYKNQDNRVGFARRRETEIRQGINTILADQTIRGDKDEVIRRLKDLSPTLASDVSGLVEGLTTMPKGKTAGTPPWDLITGLAHQADPNLTQATIQTRASTLKYFTSGQGAQQLIRLGTAIGHGLATLKDIDEQPWKMEWLKEHLPLPTELKSRMFPQTSEAVGGLQADIRTLSGEYNALMAMAGGGSMHERQMTAEDLDFHDPYRAMGNIRKMIERLADRESELKEAYRRGTSMSMQQVYDSIGKTPEGKSAIDALQRFDAMRKTGTGAAGPQAPVDYRDYFK